MHCKEKKGTGYFFPLPAVQEKVACPRYIGSGKSIAGFSLIEVVAAIAILALLSGGGLAIFSQGFKAAQKTGHQAVAVNLARAAAEEYFRVGLVNGVENMGNINLNNVTYGRTIQISDHPDFPGQLKRLEVVISWPEGGSTKNLTISALKADY